MVAEKTLRLTLMCKINWLRETGEYCLKGAGRPELRRIASLSVLGPELPSSPCLHVRDCQCPVKQRVVKYAWLRFNYLTNHPYFITRLTRTDAQRQAPSAGHARISARNEKGDIWINLITGYLAPPRLVTGVDVFTGAAPGFHDRNLHPQWRALGCDWSPWSLWSTKGLEHSISSLQLSLINCILFWLEQRIVQSGNKVMRKIESCSVCV